MAGKLTCLVTIHGIGFKQGPRDRSHGYADGLHDRLLAHPPTELGGNPIWDNDAEFVAPLSNLLRCVMAPDAAGLWGLSRP